MAKSKKEAYNKKIIWIAAGIGFLGNLAANFIWWTSTNEIKWGVGIISLVGFVILFWALSKDYGKL